MVTALLLNGGIGTRMNSDIPKQLIRINEIPIFIYSLRVFDQIEEILEVVVNYPEGWKDTIESLIEKYPIKKKIIYCEAGQTRQESVRKMLDYVKSTFVILHESARPLVNEEDIRRLIDDNNENVSMTLPIPFTVLKKDVDSDLISGNLVRDELVNILLPQKFLAKTLRECHIKAYEDNKIYTEDAAVVYDCGHTVKCITGREECFKVTTSQDVLFAEKILNNKSECY
jgi:2-C-methyl-D-erythritol 4-phosphate cytidylyltransferase